MAKTTMSEESKNDVVKEARELLASGSLLLPLRVEGWHMSLSSGGWHIKNASDRIVMTVAFVPVEIETGKPATDGNPPARHTAALLNSVPALCDEVEELRRRNATQEESITHLQSQLRVMKEAIEGAENLIVDLYDREIIPARMQYEVDGVREMLRSAITPKGSEAVSLAEKES